MIDITGASNTYASPDNDLANVVDLRTPTGPSSPASDDYGLPNAPPLGLPSYSSNRRISNVGSLAISIDDKIIVGKETTAVAVLKRGRTRPKTKVPSLSLNLQTK